MTPTGPRLFPRRYAPLVLVHVRPSHETPVDPRCGTVVRDPRLSRGAYGALRISKILIFPQLSKEMMRVSVRVSQGQPHGPEKMRKMVGKCVTWNLPLKSGHHLFHHLIIFFPYWWLSYNKLFCLSVSNSLE